MQRDDTILIAWRGDREPSVVTYRRIFDHHEAQLFDIKVKRFIKIHHQQTTDQIAFNHLVILHFGETWTTPTIVSPNTIIIKAHNGFQGGNLRKEKKSHKLKGTK